ncbi:hypothetical protein LTR70_001663 [Exophiala xenobiotica]|uniref:Uncharacterized protein n=1 Tax=Lithohypha guttulata TaxID=1690604 RepID=A0ABR0KHQ5_9EURO|nr:hypothetical protein LTR24_002555 [Lithohypha guttulata]KAK5327188.1 hypothetical protein LTR70_001663 [Exophiala xenobiotica]
MSIPTFEVANVSALWGGDDANIGPTLMTDRGLFSFDPASVKGAIVQSAADASVGIHGIKKHAKLDKSGYFYHDRSYATGSIAGLSTLNEVESPNWYTYAENGFTSKVSCFYNDTMTTEYGWQLHQYSWGLLAQTAGSLVTGKVARSINYYGYTTSDFFAWGTDYDNTTKTIAVQLITAANETNDGWGFQKFNGVQCNIKYKPDAFDVVVNITGKIVTSTPQNHTDQLWPAHGDAVLNKVSSWVSEFSFNDACVGGCQGTEDYLAAMTDDIMINLLLTRMFGNDPNPTKTVSITVAVPALIFGDRKFIIIVVVLNALISGVYVFELIRTRGWRGMPPLDFTNISDVMICASKGGMMSVRSGRHSAAQSRSWKRSTWTYSSNQPFTDRVRMCLRYNGSAYDLPGLVPLLEEGHGSPELIKEDGKWASSTVSEGDRDGRQV